MCSNIKLSKASKVIKPGTRLMYTVFTGGKKSVQMGTWGISGGTIYNVRSENMFDKWTDISENRGILRVASFKEGLKSFYHNGKMLHLAVVYNSSKEFGILTMDSQHPVSTYHRRMPVIIEDKESSIVDWLTIGYVHSFDTSCLRVGS